MHGRGWIRVVAMGAENGERLARATLNLNESGAVRRCAAAGPKRPPGRRRPGRSEEHTSELQSLMRISYAVFCLNTKKHQDNLQAHPCAHSSTRHRSVPN